MKFDIAGVTLERSSLAYRDLNSGQEIAINDLKLNTGRIAENAEGKLDFATAHQAQHAAAEAKLALNGTYALKPDSVGMDFTAKFDESTIKGKVAMARAAEAVRFRPQHRQAQPRPLSGLVGEEDRHRRSGEEGRAEETAGEAGRRARSTFRG